eukprot:5904655-Amphidinium_carterae.2
MEAFAKMGSLKRITPWQFRQLPIGPDTLGVKIASSSSAPEFAHASYEGYSEPVDQQVELRSGIHHASIERSCLITTLALVPGN